MSVTDFQAMIPQKYVLWIVTHELTTRLAFHYSLIFLPLDVASFHRYAIREGYVASTHQVTLANAIFFPAVFARLESQQEEFFEGSLRSAVVFEQDSIPNAVKHIQAISEFFSKADGKSDRQLLLIIVIKEAPSKNLETFKSSLRKLTSFFSVDCPVYLVTAHEDYTTTDSSSISRFATFWEIFSIKNLSIVQKLRFVTKTVLAPVTVSRRNNFHTAPITATSVDFEPEMNDAIASFKEAEGGLMFHEGCSVSILTDIAESLNFTILAKRSWGYMQESSPGKLTEDGKLLQDGQADISIYLSYFTAARSRMLQPLIPIMRDKLQAFFRQPPANSLRNIFAIPFSAEVWLTITLMWVSFATFYFAAFKLIRHTRGSPRGVMAASDAFLRMISAGCQKSLDIPSQNNTQMVLLLVALGTTVLLNTMYCCSIISTKLINDAPVKTLSDLQKHGFTVLAEEYSYFLSASFLKDVKDGGKGTRPPRSPYVNDQDAAAKIYMGKYAFLSTKDVVAPIFRTIGRTYQEFCSTIDSITIPNMILFSGMSVPKGSPYKESFNYRLIQLMEKGLINKYVASLYRKNKPQCPPKPNTFQKLTLGDVYSAFGICLLGSLLSILILYLERLYHPSLRRILPWTLMGRRASILNYVT